MYPASYPNNSVPFPQTVPVYTQSQTPYPSPYASSYLQPTIPSNMPTYAYPAHSSHHSRPRAHSTSYNGYTQPVIYAPSHHSHGSRRSHSHSRSHGHGGSHSHSRHHSTSGYRDSGHRHHSTAGYNQAYYAPAQSYYPSGGHQPYYQPSGHYQSSPQVANPHHSYHSRRYSEPSFGERLRHFFTFGGSSRHSRSHSRSRDGRYTSTRNIGKVDDRGREIYRV
ncbi:unnamed protein product [Somion occarium]|uniref:Uncharacterized protein n=1 Tax=Somion occarium TaxID=3059160 RepID=A0ABP1D2S6_9APHY